MFNNVFYKNKTEVNTSDLGIFSSNLEGIYIVSERIVYCALFPQFTFDIKKYFWCIYFSSLDADDYFVDINDYDFRNYANLIE